MRTKNEAMRRINAQSIEWIIFLSAVVHINGAYHTHMHSPKIKKNE